MAVIHCRNGSHSCLDLILLSADNAGVIVNPKGEMKGSAITGPKS